MSSFVIYDNAPNSSDTSWTERTPEPAPNLTAVPPVPLFTGTKIWYKLRIRDPPYSKADPVYFKKD